VEKAFKTLHQLRISLGMEPLLPANSDGAVAGAGILPGTVQSEIEKITALMRAVDRDRPRRRSDPRLLEETTIAIYLGCFRRFARYCLDQASADQPIDIRTWFSGTSVDDYLFSIYDHDRERAAVARGIAKAKLPEGVGKSSKLIQCGSALTWIAQHYLGMDQVRLVQLEDEISAYRPQRSRTIGAQNRAQLDALSEPQARLRLLWLPQKLFKLAKALLEKDPGEAAHLAMTGLAIAIELRCPLRADNLRTLQLGLNVSFEHRRGRKVVKFMLQPDATKNDAAYEWVIGDDTAGLFDAYLRQYHPILQNCSRWLFPSGNALDQPCPMDRLRLRIVRAIDEHVGVEIHMHLFRHFAVCLRLEDGSYNRAELRMLLGHKTFETTERYYAYLQPRLAAARHEAALMRAQRGLPPEIKRWLGERT
jgi:integrase